MAFDLDNRLVIGVSSRALFDLSKENELFEREGVEAYCNYQVEHEHELLQPGPGFALIRALLNLNKIPGQEGRVEVIVMSRNSPDTSLRVFNAIQEYGLDITRAALVSGVSLAPYLTAFKTDLFLSAYEEDVQGAIDCGIAAGIICGEGIHTYNCDGDISQIRIAFDGDAVLFSDKAGPFAKFLKTLSQLQREFPQEQAPIRTALVTARSAPAHERVIRTLRAWGVRIDEAFFLGGVQKKDILKAFGAHIFFDDQAVHTGPASEVVPAARVPVRHESRGP